MENAKGKTGIFEMETAEFDSWLASASVKEMADAGEAVLARLKAGGVLRQEEIRRVNAVCARMRTMWPTRVLEWILYDLPYAIIKAFQSYLIIGKLFGFGPFCRMSWLETFLPLAVWVAFRPFTASGGK